MDTHPKCLSLYTESAYILVEYSRDFNVGGQHATLLVRLIVQMRIDRLIQTVKRPIAMWAWWPVMQMWIDELVQTVIEVNRWIDNELGIVQHV